jgi:putative transposase
MLTADSDSLPQTNSMIGKSAISIARQFGGREKNFNGECFWARGYAVSTVGFELEKIRDYIRHQERLDHEEDEERF